MVGRSGYAIVKSVVMEAEAGHIGKEGGERRGAGLSLGLGERRVAGRSSGDSDPRTSKYEINMYWYVTMFGWKGGE